jgi:lambda repressor-like predicted transcriptional regulator
MAHMARKGRDAQKPEEFLSRARERGAAMSIAVDPARLKLEMDRRGLSAAALAREARLSPPTVTAALAGRPISAASLQLIAKTLARLSVLEMADVLVRRASEDRTI